MELVETSNIDMETLEDEEKEGHLQEDLLSVEIELVPVIIILEDIEPDLSPAIKIVEDFIQEDKIAINHEHLVIYQDV